MFILKHKAEMQPREKREPLPIPESHRDLLDGDACVALTTVMPDGQPQITPAWCNREGDYVMLNTMRGFRKEKNMRANPKVALLVMDPEDGSRWIEVRGNVVEIRREGAENHADLLTLRYTGKQRFYSDVYPVEQKLKETRVIVTIEPIKVSLDAIFKEKTRYLRPFYAASSVGSLTRTTTWFSARHVSASGLTGWPVASGVTCKSR
jgi:PPOX class probable F420-dependent enzyme